MKEEIRAALQFLIPYVKRSGSIKDDVLEQFHQELEKTLIERFHGHWYTGKTIRRISSSIVTARSSLSLVLQINQWKAKPIVHWNSPRKTNSVIPLSIKCVENWVWTVNHWVSVKNWFFGLIRMKSVWGMTHVLSRSSFFSTHVIEDMRRLSRWWCNDLERRE